MAHAALRADRQAFAIEFRDLAIEEALIVGVPAKIAIVNRPAANSK
jgi:hypothetical protein